MKVLIAAGGTGGHIYPGIAVANEIMRRDPSSEVLFVGTARGLESRIVPENGYQLSLIHSAGLKNVGVIGKLKGLAVLPRSFWEARRLISEFRPDVVIGAGGYVSGPVVMTASLMKVPTLIMDSNALPGFTNRRLARFIDKAALSFSEALPYFGGKGTVTGNPVREEFFDIRPKPRGGSRTLLIVGGSQGARALNNAMAEALEHFAGENIAFIHQTGEADAARIREFYDRAGFREADVRPYLSDIFNDFRRADLVVSRAGATTCAELAAAGKAAIMVPLPTAADDHQRKNAEAFRYAGAAAMILQRDLSGESLAGEIKSIINDDERLESMERAARGLARRDAAAATVELIEGIRRDAARPLAAQAV
jgi:UDP-N-acetylglucosamine--N-acetylmuramyl-(pentapeptide) pyrophosphoryl-undecaprenol N-acetylglucosamine transferase